MEKVEKMEQETTVTNVTKVKEHFKKHKWKYITGIGVGIGVYAVNAFNKSGNLIELPKITTRGINNVVKPVINNYNINVKVGEDHLGNIIRCVETGELFTSQSQAAKAMNIADSALSRHLNDKRADAGGYTFERISKMVKS